VVVVTEWDTDVSDTSFQNEAAGAVFAVLLLLFFFEDAEGVAGEMGVICIPGIKKELEFVEGKMIGPDSEEVCG